MMISNHYNFENEWFIYGNVAQNNDVDDHHDDKRESDWTKKE